ncbi:MAG: relaxase domain-containing protein [Verrucomicrobia bacterium]|nr:relaxase domain-containing protein [Verrucomicrobiota bacterium]
MFTVIAQKNLSDAKRYFDEHLSRNDYYAAEEIRPGKWLGQGVERLGLTAGHEVERGAFESLCENRHPCTGVRLTLRRNAHNSRRVFYDFTCSAPKSVSILAVTFNEERLIDAHEAAVVIAFRELEAFAASRVRKGGRQDNRTTGNLLGARFTHTTSRALDPQLHTHCTVFNATFDETERTWKALQAGAMYDAIRYATEVYRNELARRIHTLGYRTIPAEHGFQIYGVSEPVLQRFSKRSAQKNEAIRELEQKLGRQLTNDEIAHAVHRSRDRKVNDITSTKVRERHLSELSPDELQALAGLRTSANEQRAESQSTDESQSVAHAVAHVFERKSVAAEHELLEAALAHGHGEVELTALKTVLRQNPDLIVTEKGYSTREILMMELALIAAVTHGKSAVAPLNFDYSPANWLGPDQQTAMCHVLQSADRITGIRGLAGTGKTTVLRELNTACEKAGYALRFCAPTGAATEILRKEGFHAVTLESFLREDGRQSASKSIVVLDEAGAVGVDDMMRLLSLGVRVILSGDTGQHGSVKRGDALRLIEEHSPYTFGHLTQIRRQRRGDYRRVVELAAKKQTAVAFAELERLGDIIELSRDNVYRAAAEAYVSAVTERKSALLVAPTWAEIEAVTSQVRAGLKIRRRLGAEEKEVRVFDSLSWTEAQKRDPRRYRAGQLLRFHKAAGGFARDESVEIVGVAEGSLRVRRTDGSEKILLLKRDTKVVPGIACFDVGESKTVNVAAGDKLLLQANRSRRFVNGELVEVRSVQGGIIALTDGRVLPSDYNTFTHGYAVTSHAAQGKTVDAVFVLASSRSILAVHREQFYVSISRGRDEARVFTDDKELLRRHVTNSSVRLAAIEVVRELTKRRLLSLVREVAHRVTTTAHRLYRALSPAIEPRLSTTRLSRGQRL